MNNQQLYLAIGIPSLIVIFNTGIVVTLLLHFVNKLDAKVDKLDTRHKAEPIGRKIRSHPERPKILLRNIASS